MVYIDDGPYVKVLSEWQEPNDEFYLNKPIEKDQCSNHPPTILPDVSKITTKDLEFWQHPYGASPPIFGRTKNSQTGKEEFMLFDPILKLQENTMENPMLDGGGSLMKITENEPIEDGQSGKIFCSNVPRNFLNEEYCE